MNDIMDTLFGSLSKDYCIYFYYLSILGFIFMAIVLVSSLYIGITKGKGINFYIKMLSIILGYTIFYFQNRLLYSMCSGKM
jgi:small basic protein